MKNKLLATILLMAAAVCHGGVSVKTNRAALNLDDVCDGSWSDFSFQISGYDDQAFSFGYSGAAPLYQGMTYGFRLSKPQTGPLYADIPNCRFTARTTNLYWTMSRTNVPPPGTYYGELLSIDAANTNITRSLAQGTISVTWSLYLIDDDYFAAISRTNAQAGEVYVHPNWVAPPWIASTGEVGQIYVPWTSHNVLSSYVDTVQGNVDTVQTNVNTVSGMVVAAQSDINAHEALEGTNVHGLGTLAIVDDAPEDGSVYGRQDGVWTNIVTATGYVLTNEFQNTNVVFQAAIDAVEADVTTIEGKLVEYVGVDTGSSNNVTLADNTLTVIFKEAESVHSYEVISTADEEVRVMATTTNVTAAREGTTITLTVPAGTTLYGISGRWDAPNLGSSFTLVHGLGSDITDQIAPMFNAYREDNGWRIAAANLQLDMTNFDRYNVAGMETATICKFAITFPAQ